MHALKQLQMQNPFMAIPRAANTAGVALCMKIESLIDRDFLLLELECVKRKDKE